ncbi:MAG TPA: ATP-binding SpoIIE family protein phosphatase [Flavisolibacter sp.]|jgi:anti-sigma regulatory factor (Ser/Thr protein kinase)|nr:ATP-binding SpoIIE family protein phosphatase [Flavisolibacter sp.]
MDNPVHAVFKATDRSYFAILKKDIHALAASAGFSENKVGEIDIIVAEMVSNLVKHAGGGQVLVKLIQEQGNKGIELISIDNGPGMTDITRMVADGVSTKNTLGHGLGAMKRLSHVFQVYSLKDWGTVILTRIFEKEPAPFQKSAPVDIRSVILPKPGEQECGDGFFCKQQGNQVQVLLGDGLGHGPEAAKAVEKAGKTFLESEATDPVAIIRHLHDGVKKTRGLVGTVAVFDMVDKSWRICGVGNIATRINSPSTTKNYMSYNGIIGLNVPNTLNAQQLPYEKGQYLILCSDGLKSRWDTIKFPAIVRYDPSVMAAALIKDYARLTDDMSVAVCKINL